MLRNVTKWLMELALLSAFVGCTHVQASAPAVPEEVAPPDAGSVSDEEETSPGIEIPLREDGGVDNPEEKTPVEVTTVAVPKLKEIEEPVVAKKEKSLEDGYSPADIKLAKGIFNLKMKTHHGIWWECGKRYETKDEIKAAALEWAAAINDSYKNTEYQLRSGTYVRPPIKEAVGIMISESKFDRCAIGPHPRNFAYKKNIIQRPANNISHTLEEIQRIVEHPSFRGRKADIGVGQIVKRLGEGYLEWDDVLPYLTVVPGVQKVFDEMAYRGKFYNTKHPALHWPGSRKHKWYQTRVLRLGIPVFGQLRRSEM